VAVVSREFMRYGGEDEMRAGVKKAFARLLETPEIVLGFFRSPDLAYVDIPVAWFSLSKYGQIPFAVAHGEEVRVVEVPRSGQDTEERERGLVSQEAASLSSAAGRSLKDEAAAENRLLG
jgi:hypothetical protein